MSADDSPVQRPPAPWNVKILVHPDGPALTPQSVTTGVRTGG